MDDQAKDVGSTPVPGAPVEGWMLREDVVREVQARLARGEHVKTIARELGVDKKTIKRWRQRGGWRPRAPRVYPNAIDAHRPFLERRGPEVGWNGVVLLRELRTQGFTGGYQQVQRALQPLRTTRQWAARATVRFETGPGEQAQIDFGQLQVWIADVATPVHFFVFTLGFSRRAVAYAYRNERLDTLLEGHERALRHFGGVLLSCLYDNPRTITTGRAAGHVLWHPRFEDFPRYYGFTPRACQPYRARTKGKVESGVKYVKRNALAGRRFASWAALEAWLEEWAATVSDVRVHGTTHERPIDRFARETGARHPRLPSLRRPVERSARRRHRTPVRDPLPPPVEDLALELREPGMVFLVQRVRMLLSCRAYLTSIASAGSSNVRTGGLSFVQHRRLTYA